jgi:hypothetical protein
VHLGVFASGNVFIAKDSGKQLKSGTGAPASDQACDGALTRLRVTFCEMAATASRKKT